jgi:CDP-2,3-bis-(O-geranylgeranyl)-sn-glycerol synthase
MLVLANGAPVLAARLCGPRWNRPIDGGRLFPDGKPVLGHNKTWRGLVIGVLASGLFSLVIGMGVLFGCLFGLLALVGDAASSFIKRRRGLEDSARASGLDQIPEALLPMLLAGVWLPLGWMTIVLVVAGFTASNVLVSPLLFRLGIRQSPH